MRKTNFRTETVMIEKKVYDSQINICDFCAGENQQDDFDLFSVAVLIDPNGCVGTRITRDSCQYCYDTKLSKALDVFFKEARAGDEELKEHHQDSWYG